MREKFVDESWLKMGEASPIFIAQLCYCPTLIATTPNPPGVSLDSYDHLDSLQCDFLLLRVGLVRGHSFPSTLIRVYPKAHNNVLALL